MNRFYFSEEMFLSLIEGEQTPMKYRGRNILMKIVHAEEGMHIYTSEENGHSAEQLFSANNLYSYDDMETCVLEALENVIRNDIIFA